MATSKVDLSALENIETISSPAERTKKLKENNDDKLKELANLMKEQLAELKKNPSVIKQERLRTAAIALSDLAQERRMQTRALSENTSVGYLALAETIAIVQEVQAELTALDKDIRSERKESNNLPYQAKMLVEFISAHTQANIRTEGISEIIEGKYVVKNGAYKDGHAVDVTRYFDLGSTNIPSLLRSLVNEEKYIPDGYYGGEERFAVERVKKIYADNEDTLKPLFKQLIRVYAAGSTTEQAARTLPFKGTDDKSAIDYISDVTGDGVIDNKSKSKEDAGRYTVLPEDEIRKILPTSQEKLLLVVNNALRFAGKSVILDGQTVVVALSNDPYLKYDIIAGLNKAALAHQISALYKQSGKAITLSEVEKEAAKTLSIEGIRSALSPVLLGKIDDAMKKIDEDNSISAEAKVAKKEAYKLAIEKVKSNSAFMTETATSFALALTNKSVNLGAGKTFNLNSMLADNVTIVAGLHGKEVGIGAVFGKGLIETEKARLGIGYGVFNLVPFATMSGRVDDIHLDVAGSPVGGTVAISKEMGEIEKARRELDGMGKPENFWEEVSRYAGDLSKKASNVNFTGNSKYFDRLNEEDKNAYRTATNSITTDIRSRLSLTDFDTVGSPMERAILLRRTIEQIINERRYALNLDTSRAGWSLSRIGAVFGAFGPIVFASLGVAFSKMEVQESTLVRGEKNAAKLSTSTQITELGKVKQVRLWAGDKSMVTFENKLPASTIFVLPTAAAWLWFDGDEGDSNRKIVGICGLGEKQVSIVKKDGMYVVTETNKDLPKEKTEDTPSQDQVNNVNILAVDNLVELHDKVLLNHSVRTSLSGLWLHKNTRTETNKFVISLRRNEWLEKSMNACLAMLDNGVKKWYKASKLVLDSMRTIKDNSKMPDSDKMIALYEIRSALMSDVDPRKGLMLGTENVPKKVQWLRETKEVFSKYVNALDAKYRELWLKESDFAKVTGSISGGRWYHEGTIQKNVFGAVASLKSNPPAMDGIPTGNVRIAKDSQGKEIVSIVNPEDTDTKKRFAKIVLAANSSLRWALTLEGITNLNDQQQLLALGYVNVDGKVHRANVEFISFAYGACLNPSIGVRFKPSTPSTILRTTPWNAEINPTEIIESATENDLIGVNTGFSTTNIAILVGGEKDTDAGKNKPEIGSTPTDARDTTKPSTDPSDPTTPPTVPPTPNVKPMK